jgi:hypothetical protein
LGFAMFLADQDRSGIGNEPAIKPRGTVVAAVEHDGWVYA